PRGVKSAQELEDQLVAENKKNQFKARPVSKRALESYGDLGVPKVAKRDLTVPCAPKLHTSDRSLSRSRESSIHDSSLNSLSEISMESFRARPAPKRRPATARPAEAPRKLTRRPATARPAAEVPHKLTIPTSPNLHTSCRSSSVRRLSASSLTSLSLDGLPLPSFKAAPAPDMRRKFVPKHEQRALTEPKPFNLSSDARRPKEAAGSQEALPKKAAAPAGPHGLTDPKPFNLAGDQRHEFYRSKWAAQVDRELEEERNRFSSFQSRKMPAAITDANKVFTPRRSAKPLTEVHDFELNSDRRSLSRQAYDSNKVHDFELNSDRRSLSRQAYDSDKAKREARQEEDKVADDRRALEQEKREV
ncbi:hypothetical protein T484DRAFT_1768920, partial [Baffinella frigidus]